MARWVPSWGACGPPGGGFRRAFHAWYRPGRQTARVRYPAARAAGSPAKNTRLRAYPPRARARRDDDSGAAGPGPWPLLDQQELPAGVVGAGPAEVDHRLQREHQVAVQVAVQGVPVALLVFQQDRGGLALAGGVAHVQPFI